MILAGLPRCLLRTALFFSLALSITPPALGFGGYTALGYSQGLSGYSETWADPLDVWDENCEYVEFGWYYCEGYQVLSVYVQAHLYAPGGGQAGYGYGAGAWYAYTYVSSGALPGWWTAIGHHSVDMRYWNYYCLPSQGCGGYDVQQNEYLGQTGDQVFVPSPPVAVIPFEIWRHATASLTEGEVDGTIFPDANSLLQTSDGPGDVACAIAFQRSGPIGVFTVGDGAIDSLQEREDVIAVPGRVKLVREINYCSGGPTPGEIIGCSAGAGMIVVRIDPQLEGILWAHEYGHNQDLWLLGHKTDPNSLGYGGPGNFIQPSMRRVTESECNAMRSALN